MGHVEGGPGSGQGCESQAAQDVDKHAPGGCVGGAGRDAVAGVDVAAVTESARARRRRPAIPDEGNHFPTWILTVEMLDE